MAHRPRDPNELAKAIVDIATGQAEDSISERKRHPEGVKGRAGGLLGGVARARALAAKKRSVIAKKAAATRWRNR
jgi:hypothetical protein